jgi:hypothetical protein
MIYIIPGVSLDPPILTFFFVVLGVEFRAFTLSSPVFVKGFSK